MDLLRSLPIGLYLDQPITRLHQLDARVKFIWLMAFLAAPLLANPWWRLALVGLLMFLTLLAPIPNTPEARKIVSNAITEFESGQKQGLTTIVS